MSGGWLKLNVHKNGVEENTGLVMISTCRRKKYKQYFAITDLTLVNTMYEMFKTYS